MRFIHDIQIHLFILSVKMIGPDNNIFFLFLYPDSKKWNKFLLHLQNNITMDLNNEPNNFYYSGSDNLSKLYCFQLFIGMPGFRIENSHAC
jgi:hypothetical protein